MAAAAAFTGCEEPLACDEGNKATLTVYNYTACTPDIVVDGDVIAEDLGATFIEGVAGDSVVIELDNGVLVWPSSDDEGNDAGALFTTDKRVDTLPVIN